MLCDAWPAHRTIQDTHHEALSAGLAVLSNLRSLKLVAPCAPSRTVAAGLDEGLAGLTALQELSLALHSTMFTVRTRRLVLWLCCSPGRQSQARVQGNLSGLARVWDNIQRNLIWKACWNSDPGQLSIRACLPRAGVQTLLARFDLLVNEGPADSLLAVVAFNYLRKLHGHMLVSCSCPASGPRTTM